MCMEFSEVLKRQHDTTKKKLVLGIQLIIYRSIRRYFKLILLFVFLGMLSNLVEDVGKWTKFMDLI